MANSKITHGCRFTQAYICQESETPLVDYDTFPAKTQPFHLSCTCIQVVEHPLGEKSHNSGHWYLIKSRLQASVGNSVLKNSCPCSIPLSIVLNSYCTS